MALSAEEQLLYRNLKTILDTPAVNDTLVRWASMQYNIALKNLVVAKEPIEVGKWQQAVMIYEHIQNLKPNVNGILRNAKSAA